MKLNFLGSSKISSEIIILLVLSTILSSCVSPTKYYWGEYQNLIYNQYQEPGKATPEIQIQIMEADIQKAASKNQPLPPGFYAHLGSQYLQTGKAGEARQYFNAEKRAFPESAVLMDRFLRKIK